VAPADASPRACRAPSRHRRGGDGDALTRAAWIPTTETDFREISDEMKIGVTRPTWF